LFARNLNLVALIASAAHAFRAKISFLPERASLRQEEPIKQEDKGASGAAPGL